jgi:hypothetical protein
MGRGIEHVIVLVVVCCLEGWLLVLLVVVVIVCCRCWYEEVRKRLRGRGFISSRAAELALRCYIHATLTREDGSAGYVEAMWEHSIRGLRTGSLLALSWRGVVAVCSTWSCQTSYIHVQNVNKAFRHMYTLIHNAVNTDAAQTSKLHPNEFLIMVVHARHEACLMMRSGGHSALWYISTSESY